MEFVDDAVAAKRAQMVENRTAGRIRPAYGAHPL
jgi:hypothetical protein